MKYGTMIEQMKDKGIRFQAGMTDEEFIRMEKALGIRFPESLQSFYRLGVPYSEESFPDWKNSSEENVTKLRQWMRNPVDWLREAVERGFWLNCWGDCPASADDVLRRYDELTQGAPVMIPVYGHRFVPMLDDTADPPVLSAVGQDIICYGRNLERWLGCEFLGEDRDGSAFGKVPFWEDVIWKRK